MAEGKDVPDGDGRSDRLDAGLRAAFGAGENGSGESVPEAGAESPSVVESLGFGAPRVMLDSPPGEHTPLVSPISPELADVERVVGRYQVVGEIAQGGVGVILKARDRDLGRDCAMKLLRSELLTKPTVVQRFVEEAQVGAQLQHPGIVPVYELGLLADSRPYFTMKLVKGETLAVLLSERKSPKEDLRRYLDIFERVCQTVSYAHARDVVHRDLKPWNIMIGDYGDVKVMDWGFAKVRPPAGRGKLKQDVSASQISIIETIRSLTSSEKSLSGAVIGTPAYMPPEQAMGEIDRLDERADIFALGSILTEILTGQPAYTGDSVDEILFKASRSRLEEAKERLDKCGADSHLIELAKQCMAPAKAARPRDASEVAMAITGHLSGLEADAQRSVLAAAEEKERARGERRARRLTLSIAAAVVAAVLVAGSLFVLIDRNRRNASFAANRRLAGLVEDAEALRRAAEANPSGGAERWSRPEASAEAALRFAKGSGADDDLIDRARGLLGWVRDAAASEQAAEEGKKHRKEMSRRLAEVRTVDWESPGCPRSADAWAKAFRDLGVDVERLPPKEAAGQLGVLPMRREIIAALDDWSRDLRDRGPVPESENRPLQVLRVLDPESIRDRIRFLNAGKAPRARRAELITIAKSIRPDEMTPDTAALLGESLIVAGRPEAALAPLRAALALDPTRARLHFALGWALLSVSPSRPEEAMRHFTAVTARKPDCCGARLGLLIAAAGAGEFEEAEEALRLLRDDFPGDQRVLAHRGRIQIAAGKTSEGLKTLAEASAGAAEDPWIRTVNAEALLADGDVAGALRESTEARSVAPGYRPAHLVWIRALDLTGDLPKATDAYSAMAKKAEHWAEARYLLGTTLLLLGQGEEAVRVLTEAVGRVPGDPDYWFELGRAKFALGQDKDAVADFDKALTFRPGFPAARRFRAAALRSDLDSIDAALQERQLAAQERPGDPVALADLAVEHLSRRDLPSALDASEAAIRAVPLDARCRFVRGIALGRAGNVKGACDSFRMAVTGDPGNLHYLLEYGYFLLHTGRFADEYTNLKVESRTRPGDAFLRTQVGCLDFVAGRQEDALGHVDAALGLRSDLSLAHQLRSLVLQRLGRDEECLAACVGARDAEPGRPDAWHELGRARLSRGDFLGARRCFVRARATGAVDPLWRFGGPGELFEALRMLTLAEGYADAIRGDVKVDGPRERLALARLCRRKGNHEVAFRYYLEAWEEGGRQFPGDVFPAAGAAATCAGRLPERERIDRADVALVWLEQGLQSLRHIVRRGGRDIAVMVLDRWTHDPGLAVYREGLSLDKLPEAQADGFRDFWRRADTLLARCRGRREYER